MHLSQRIYPLQCTRVSASVNHHSNIALPGPAFYCTCDPGPTYSSLWPMPRFTTGECSLDMIAQNNTRPTHPPHWSEAEGCRQPRIKTQACACISTHARRKSEERRATNNRGNTTTVQATSLSLSLHHTATPLHSLLCHAFVRSHIYTDIFIRPFSEAKNRLCVFASVRIHHSPDHPSYLHW